MKKLLLITLMLAASQLSAETVTWKQGNEIAKTIDDKIRIYHTPGKQILAQYLQAVDALAGDVLTGLEISVGNADGSITTIKVRQLFCTINYSHPGKFSFLGGYTFRLYPPVNPAMGTNTVDAISIASILEIENLTTSEAFEKQAQEWIKKEVSNPTFVSSKEALNKIPGYKEVLTQALQLAVKEWKRFIVLIKAEIDEESKKEYGKETMENLQKLKALLANFK